jgi:hypothetical protein
MPTWLAIAIPSVIAVAACLMWALDYWKKAQEIQKLRLEVVRLEHEAEDREREYQKRAAGLYRLTPEEVDRFSRPAEPCLVAPEIMYQPSPPRRPRIYKSVRFSPLLTNFLMLLLMIYGVVRLVIDLWQRIF